MKANPQKDKITVNEKPIEIGKELVYIAVNKPRNVISAASPQDNRITRKLPKNWEVRFLPNNRIVNEVRTIQNEYW